MNAVDVVIKELQRQSKPVTTPEEIAQVIHLVFEIFTSAFEIHLIVMLDKKQIKESSSPFTFSSNHESFFLDATVKYFK